MSTSLPPNPDLQQIRKLAKELLHQHRAGDREAAERIRKHHPRYLQADSNGEGILSLQDAQLAIAREFGQRNWSRLVAVVELMRQVHRAITNTECIHVVARDASQLQAFKALLRPHYDADQLRVLRPFARGGEAKSMLSSAIRLVVSAPILLSEYQTLGLAHLMEHQHKPKAPFQVESHLARTHAILSRSVHGRRSVLLGVKAHVDESNFKEVFELSPRELAQLYGSTTVVNL